MFRKDSLEGAKTTWRLDVTNQANTHHGRRFQNGDGFDNFFLVRLYIQQHACSSSFIRLDDLPQKASCLYFECDAPALNTCYIYFRIDQTSAKFQILTWTRSVDFTKNMRHAGLVSQEGSQMHRFAWVILWKGLHFTTISFTPLLWQKCQRSMTWSWKFSVRLKMITGG